MRRPWCRSPANGKPYVFLEFKHDAHLLRLAALACVDLLWAGVVEGDATAPVDAPGRPMSITGWFHRPISRARA
ncbi:MAG: hypothetical protein O6916_00475 [bacterium]|nr:hypothetical protein [bacterium]